MRPLSWSLCHGKFCFHGQWSFRKTPRKEKNCILNMRLGGRHWPAGPQQKFNREDDTQGRVSNTATDTFQPAPAAYTYKVTNVAGPWALAYFR